MCPPNLFHDICPNQKSLTTALKRMNLTKASYISSEKLNSFQNLSIANFDSKDAHTNMIQLKFFNCIINYYKHDSVTVFDVLKQQHYYTLIITNNGGGMLYVLSPTEGSFILFLHIGEHDRSKGLGTLLLQMIQKETRNKLKTSNMLVWVEVHPKQNEQSDISLYYKRLGFHLTPPEKYHVQHIVPVSVLSVIQNKEL